MSIGPFDTKRIRHETSIGLAVVIGITAVLLLYSAICPPPGQIHESIIDLVPWVPVICAILVAREAILEGLGVKYTKGDLTIEVDKKDE